MRIDICLAADDNYAKYMGTVIASILSNSKEDEEIYFHLLDGGITEENKQKLLLLKKIKDCCIKFYNPDIEKYKKWYEMGTHYKGRFSPAMFYRLDIHKLVSDVDKILYLDCDTIVRSSVKELFEIDITNYYALVVDNARNNNYFNSGVILFNSKLCRESNIENDFNEYFYQNNGNVWGDEGILNACLINKVKFVEKKWNYLANKTEELYKKYDIDEIKIIHYLVLKPWNADSKKVILANEFWKYYQFTSWYIENPLEAVNVMIQQQINDYDENNLNINRLKFLGIYKNDEKVEIVILFIKITININIELLRKVAWWIPIRKWRDSFKGNFGI